MVKSLGQTDAARRLLTGCVVVLTLLAVMPLSVTGWVSYLSAVPRALVVPASSQVMKLATWIGGPTVHQQDFPNASDVQRTLAEQQTLIAQLRAENDRLQHALRELGGIMLVDPGTASIRTLIAPVIGSFSGSPGSVLRVKAGSSNGVTKGAVAVGPLRQIVGLVTDVETRTCTLRLLTSKETETFRAAIMINDAETLACVLSPAPGGVLKGDIEWPSDAATRERLVPMPGQYVRLEAGGIWPRAANMLIVGTVEAIEQSTSAPGRKAVVVRPTVDPLNRVGEVILMLEAAPLPREGAP
jgi:cell shape-determining protein MreC